MKEFFFVNDKSKLLYRVVLDWALSPREHISVTYELLVFYTAAPAVQTGKLELVLFSFNDANDILIIDRHLILNKPVKNVRFFEAESTDVLLINLLYFIFLILLPIKDDFRRFKVPCPRG